MNKKDLINDKSLTDALLFLIFILVLFNLVILWKFVNGF